MVGHAGRGGDEVEVELALKPLLDDLHMQQSQKTASEPEAEGFGILGLESERSVVELQLQQGFLEVVVPRAVGGINAGEHHRRDLLVSFERSGRGAVGGSDGVAHGGVRDVLYTCGDISHLTGGKRRYSPHSGGINTDFHHFEGFAGGEHFYPVPRLHRAVDYAHHRYGAAVIVVIAVENESLERRGRISSGRRQFLHYLPQHVVYAYALFRGDERTACRIQPDDVLYLFLHSVNVRGRKVDLVDDGKYLKVVVEREVDVGQRLRFDALRRVHHEQRALARGKRARNLVGEVHVSRSVYEVESVLLSVVIVKEPARLQLYGDAPLLLDVHVVEELVRHIP